LQLSSVLAASAPEPQTSQTPRSARDDDEDVKVEEVFQEFEKNPTIQSTSETVRRSSTAKTMTAAEKRKLLEEKRKKLAADRKAKNKT